MLSLGGVTAGPVIRLKAMAHDGIAVGDDGVPRCRWADSAPEYRAYHDTEWGFPVADDVRLFEKLSLEGFQAGLSWLTILRKREAFRRAFAGFDYRAGGRLRRARRRPAARRRRDRAPPGQDRGRDQQRAARARAGRGGGLAGALRLALRAAGARRRLDRAALAELAVTAESTALAKDLKRRGWRFVGPTTVYAFMQAMGLVNDHLDGCDAQPRAAEARATFTRPAMKRFPAVPTGPACCEPRCSHSSCSSGRSASRWPRILRLTRTPPRSW